jgi:transposase
MFIMEVMGKARRARRVFTPEYKAEIVALVRRGDRSIKQIARDFDLSDTAVAEWVRKAEGPRGLPPIAELTEAERTELAELRLENRRLREDVEILKRAAVFFAKETR